MEYTVSQLAKMSGVSTRTLRYYDEIGLLSPVRIEHNKYRIYGKKEVDLLQQILFYRELGVPLERIDQIIKAPDFDKEMISKNESQYGKEIREKYGDDAIDASYDKIKGMSKEKWEEAHKALADGYVADERFTAYYDKIAPRCTRFLRDVIYSYYKEQ